MKISSIKAREIIDSRANPTVEVDLILDDGSFGRAAVPSGASTGTHEAIELRDGDKSRWLGKGVLKAVANVNEKIFNEVVGKEFSSQEEFDNFLIKMDGSDNKGNLGANAILGASLAFAQASASSLKLDTFQYISEIFGSETRMPRPMFNIMNGGRHANWSTDVQEFMIIVNREKYSDMLRIACELFLTLEKVLVKKNLSTNVGNEGGFAPGFSSNTQAFDTMLEAVSESGYEAGRDISFAVDVAASEFFSEGRYTLKRESRSLSPIEWTAELKSWVSKYPIISIEDPFSEDDWNSWVSFNSEMGDQLQIVGDDLLVTNVKRIEEAISKKACNTLLVKPNQIGTLTETLSAMKLSANAGWGNVVSHRSGETEDVIISHIAVGTGCGQIKSGAPSRGERTAKFNELLRIEEKI